MKELKVDRALLGRLAFEMDSRGFGVVEGYLSAGQLGQLREFVVSLVAASGGQYVVLNGARALSQTPLAALGQDPALVSLLHGLYEAGSGQRAPEQGLYQVLRALAGSSGLKHAFKFHYDSYVVSALLPVLIPTGVGAGHLLLGPRRPLRKFYVLNLLDKLLLDNPASQTLLRTSYRRWFKPVHLEPGNLYLFWGYRTVHANEPADPAQIRATALFHFGDPHAGSWLKGFLRGR